MLLLAQNNLLAIGLVVLALVGVILVSLLIARNRASVWRKFARHHRMKFREENGFPRVAGEVGRRSFLLEVDQESSDTGELGVQVVTMRLGLHGPLPAGLEIVPAVPLVGGAQRALEPDAVVTGDEAFDPHWIARGDSAAEVVRYLDEARRAALLRLSADARSGISGIRDGYVFIQDRDVVSRLSHLDERLGLLASVASTLDRQDQVAGAILGN